MRIVASRLNKPVESISDATIAAVALLSSSDNHFDWPAQHQSLHSRGMAQLVAMRGGIDILSSNRRVQRVVAWADLLRSAMHGTNLQVKLPSNIADPSPETSPAVDSDEGRGMSTGILLPELPPSIAYILRHLRILPSLKSVFVRDRCKELCRTFSDLLWRLEYSILDLEEQFTGGADPASQDEMSGHKQMANAVGIAALMFSYSCLRDLAAPDLFDKLRKRLRNSLTASGMPSSPFLTEGQEDRATNQSHVSQTR